METKKVLKELNNILRDIKEPLLTTVEFESIKIESNYELRDLYVELSKVIINRGGEGNALKKLKLKASIDGVESIKRAEYKRDTSNIFIGANLSNVQNC